MYGMLNGDPAGKFIQMHKDILGPLLRWPDLTIFLDISGEESARRLAKAKKQPELFEKTEIQEKIRQNYLQLAKNPEFGNSVVVINGERPEEEVFEHIKKIVLPNLPSPKLPFQS